MSISFKIFPRINFVRLLDVIAAIPNGVQRFDPASKMADMSLSIGLGQLSDDGMVKSNKQSQKGFC